jgi:PAS domain S-box-containing protein
MNVFEIFSVPVDRSMLVSGQYDPGLIALSIAISIFASFMALHTVGQAARATNRFVRMIALATGSLALGVGIWAMHFIGMLAFSVCTSVSYDPIVTMASMLPGLAASFVALSLIAKPNIGRVQLMGGGVLVGAGIGAMHYAGMAAMRMSLAQRYDPAGFALSIAVAVVLAVVALWIRFGLNQIGARWSTQMRLLASATIMGSAISGMHYTGMTAARFVGRVGSSFGSTANAEFLGIAIALATVVLTVCVLGANGLIRYRALVQSLRLNEAHLSAILSERQKMESALRDSEEQFRSLIVNIPGISFRAGLGKGMPMIFVSDAVGALTGYPSSDFVGDPPRRNIFDLVFEDDRATILSAIRGSVESHRPFQNECRLRHRDGSVRWMWGNANAVFGADGAPKWLDGVILDITERRHMEEQLRDAKERAEHAVAARTAFMANMSHEIRTPMNSILGFTDVMLQAHLSTEHRRYLEIVRNSGRSLLRLLNEILDSAKLDKGAVDLEFTDFDLLGLIDEISSGLGATARAKNVELLVRLDPRLPRWFRGDELRIRQVLLNLLSNGVKFTQAGAVTLTVEGRGDCVHFAVADTGIGIAADRLDAIFEPFTQADVSMSRRFGGTGLGTTISKKLVELMNGRIWVESTLGQGSTFHVEIPLAASQPRDARPRASRTKVSLPSLRILVVDDVLQNLELITLLLRNDGHHVIAARDGEQASIAAEAGGINLILMDMQMPGMDGTEAARRIRAREARTNARRIPIIAITASVLESDRKAARDAGMDGFASKPVDSAELTREIARVLHLQVPTTAALPLAAGASELDLSQVHRLGSRLLQSLQRGAMDEGCFEQFLGAMSGHTDAEGLDQLRCAIDDFDFERAHTQVRELLAEFAVPATDSGLSKGPGS